MEKAFVLMLCLLMAFSLAACAQAPAEPLDEPIPLSYFSFSHRGSSSDSIYTYTAEKTAEGTDLYIQINAGNSVVEVTVEEDVLASLGKIAAEHRLDMWDGFDKAKSNVSDGSGFTLSMTTEDGQSVYAHGSNAFPDGFQEAKVKMDALFDGLVFEYGNLWPKVLESDDMNYFNFFTAAGNHKKLSVTAFLSVEGDYCLDLHLKGYEEIFPEEYFFSGESGTFPFEELQAVVRKYDIPAWNGWDKTGGDDTFQLILGYSTEERVSARGSLHPEGYAEAAAELEEILLTFIGENSASFEPYVAN